MAKNNLKIKVCGITRYLDAKNAVRFGTDMLGFIFYKKSPRYISTNNALEVMKQIPATVGRVGVFVNEKTDTIIKIGKFLRLDFIQLSGVEPKKDVEILHKSGFKVIKTVRVKNQDDILKVKHRTVDIIHLDTADKELYGGTGKKFNWDLKIPNRMNNLMLAGGIDKDNVLEGIVIFNPLIVDVNSGVEIKPGVKSEKKLYEFFEIVNDYRYGKK